MMPVPTYPSVTAATATHPNLSTVQGASGTQISDVDKRYIANPYSTSNNSYDYWKYSQSYAAQSSYPYGYAGYYPNAAVSGSSQQYNPYAYPQYNQHNYNNGQMNWQQAYSQQSGQNHNGSTMPPHASSSSMQFNPNPMSHSTSHPSNSTVQTHPYAADTSNFTSSGNDQTRSSSAITSSQPSSFPFNSLAPLSSLDPSQIADILRDNPALREIVLAAVGQARKKS